MDYLNLLVDTKKEFSIYLINNLSPEINKGISSIFLNCKNRVDDNNSVLIAFQQILSDIPKWNNSIIFSETNRIKEKIPYIEDLLTAVFISNMRLLCSIKNKNKQIKIKVPKLDIFIHKCYIECAKEFWSYTYLFNENINKLEIQKNKRQIDIIIKNSIEEVIRKLLPIKTILKDYLETNLDSNEEEPEINDSLVDIIKNSVNEHIELNKKNIPTIENTLQESENKTNQIEHKETHIPIEISNSNNDLDVHSEFNFDENLFLNTASNDIIDQPDQLFKFNSDIKVVNIYSEDKDKDKDKDKLESNKEKIDTDKKNFLDKFESHHSN